VVTKFGVVKEKEQTNVTRKKINKEATCVGYNVHDDHELPIASFRLSTSGLPVRELDRNKRFQSSQSACQQKRSLYVCSKEAAMAS
jgi:hypothetical protein